MSAPNGTDSGLAHSKCCRVVESEAEEPDAEGKQAYTLDYRVCRLGNYWYELMTSTKVETSMALRRPV